MGKILIIESAEFLSLKMVKILKDGGLLDIDTSSGFELSSRNINYFFAGITLVLIDLENLHLDPLQVVKDLKKNPETSAIPIIAIGSDSQWGTLKAALSAGVCDFIVKPFGDQILLSKVLKWSDKKDLNAVDMTQYQASPVALNSVTGIQWNDEFAIGIEAIDQDHKAIFDKYQELYGLMKQGLGHDYYNELGEFLTDYIDAHFAREESYQASIKYKECDAHKAFHKRFIGELQGMLVSKKDKEISNNDLIRMNMFIKDWLLHHIFIEDRKYVAADGHISK